MSLQTERALLKSVPLLPLLFLSEWVVKVVSRERFLALIEILPNIEDVSDSFGVCSCWGICNFVGGFILLLRHLMWNSGFSSEETVDLFCERSFSGQLLERTGVCSPSESV